MSYKGPSHADQIRHLIQSGNWNDRTEQRLRSILSDIALIARNEEHARLKGKLQRKLTKAVLRYRAKDEVVVTQIAEIIQRHLADALEAEKKWNALREAPPEILGPVNAWFAARALLAEPEEPKP